jgi:hypothetical protein
MDLIYSLLKNINSLILLFNLDSLSKAPGLFLTIKFSIFLSTLALGLFFLYFAPKNVLLIHQQIINHPLKSFFLGIISALFYILITILLGASIIGIVLLPLIFLFLFSSLLFGYISFALTLGLLPEIIFKKSLSTQLRYIIGLTLLMLISFIPILGNILKLIGLIISFGAISSLMYQKVKNN